MTEQLRRYRFPTTGQVLDIDFANRSVYYVHGLSRLRNRSELGWNFWEQLKARGLLVTEVPDDLLMDEGL